MATRRDRFDLKIKIWDKLSLLKDDLSRLHNMSNEPEISEKFLEAHDIELHSNDHFARSNTGNLVKAQRPTWFATPLSSKVTDEAFEDAFKDEEQPGWPAPLDPAQRDLDFFDPGIDPSHLDIRTPYFIALKISGSLLCYRTHLDWKIRPSSWARMGGATKKLPFYNFNTRWATIEMFRATNEAKPHLATLVIDETPTECGLRRSELLCAVNITLSSMLIDKRHENMVNPVFVYSIAYCHFRVLQVHFDYLRDVLVVNTTPYIDLTEGKEEDIKQCLRWMMSTPTGQTKYQKESGEGVISDDSDPHSDVVLTQCSSASSSDRVSDNSNQASFSSSDGVVAEKMA